MCVANKTRLYEALGQVEVAFHALERGIDRLLLCSLASPEAKEKIHLCSFQEKLIVAQDVIRELHHDLDMGMLGFTLDKVVERCCVCEEQRNQWIRAYWLPEIESSAGLFMRLSHTADAQGLTMEPVNMADLADFVRAANATLGFLSGFHQNVSLQFRRVRQLPECYSPQLTLVVG